jgi:hypothetical protein
VSRPSGDSGIGLLFGYYREVREVGHAEGGSDDHVGSVTACGDQDASYARLVVARVKSPPSIFKIDLKPRAEVHGSGGGHADVAQISRDVTRGNVQGAAHGDGKMLKVSADAEALGVDVQSGLGGTRVLIPEADPTVNPIANSLNARPSRRDRAKSSKAMMEKRSTSQ